MATSQSIVISAEQALLELTLRNAEQSDRAFDDVFVAGIRGGLPAELLTRLKVLWDETQVIAGEIVAIGKIIIGEIVAFFKANPGMTAGIALGAAVGLLVNAVPLIGPFLAPIAALLGGIYGGGLGSEAQRGAKSTALLGPPMELARKFFEMLIAILNAVTKYWAAR